MATLFFISGVIVGSFLNVMLFRYNSGRNVLGRSYCMHCGHTLSAIELIPIISFLAQAGRCRACESKVSPQYPIVEALTGALFLGVYLMDLPVLSLAYMLVATSLLVLILVYDFRHQIIPNGLVYAFALMGLISVFVDFGSLSILNPEGSALIAGPLLFLPFFLLWFLSRGRLMGLGDGKLALGIGWFLGLSDGLLALALAFWAGALVGIVLIVAPIIYRKIGGVRGKQFNLKSAIPFAPFLILSFFAVLFFDINLYALILP